MKVCVTTILEVNHPIFDTLYNLHANGLTGESAQYHEAIKTIEQVVGIPFFDAEHSAPRITGVYSADDEVPILEG